MQKRQLWLHFLFPAAVLLVLAIVLGVAYAYDDWQRSLFARNSVLHINNEVRIAAKDLAEQMSMARFAYWQAWLSFGALIMSALGLYGVFYSLMLTRDALKTTRHFAEIESSAFLHAKQARWGRGNSIVLKIWNSGQTPAGKFKVYLNADVFADHALPEKLDFSLNKSKESAMVAPSDGKDILIDIPPNVDRIKLCSPTVECEGNNIQMQNHLDRHKLNIIFTGEIHYNNIHNKAYRTQFSFFIGHENINRFKQPARELIVHQPLPDELISGT